LVVAHEPSSPSAGESGRITPVRSSEENVPATTAERSCSSPKRFYDQLTASAEFRDTHAWADLDPAGYDGLILPGGHAPGMRQYLGSEVLREKVARPGDAYLFAKTFLTLLQP
jgi:hypothetical protein